MASGEPFSWTGKLYSKTQSILVDGSNATVGGDSYDTLQKFINDNFSSYGVTNVSYTQGGTPLDNTKTISDIGSYEFQTHDLYDVTPEPEPEPETITGFYLDGIEYEIGGGAEYNAGTGISIGDVLINGRKGPSPDGFHVPAITEWQGVETIMTSLSLTGRNWTLNLHMPIAGYRDYLDASLVDQEVTGLYWSSSPYGSDEPSAARYVYMYSTIVEVDSGDVRTNGASIRCFKDSYVTPDSSWTVVQGTLGNAGIFWNQSEGLISITDGTTGYTMMDKNLGATTVYNEGETLTQANMGNMYQWGNNYGFPSTGTISNTSSTQVDASSYGPTNPYSSDTFIIGNDDWSSVHNDDLWGDTTGTITQENVISNTGVLSVNGETGDVTNVVTGDGQYVINVSATAPASGTASNIITIVTD